jgi:hypothetical protein
MREGVKCPRCGGVMEEGYIKMTEGIRWRTSDHSWGKLLRWGTVFWPRDYSAYLCRKCRWILFSYKEDVEL